MERIRTEIGTVIACDENRNLTAMLDDGQEVIIPFSEVHKDETAYDLSRHVGREIELVDTYRRSADGRKIYSHKIVEENDFEWLRYNFERGIRNTTAR